MKITVKIQPLLAHCVLTPDRVNKISSFAVNYVIFIYFFINFSSEIEWGRYSNLFAVCIEINFVEIRLQK